MKMIATPAAQGGASLDQIRKLAGRTMLTSTILGVPQEMASREMANLLAGRAGAHNILGSRLGLIGAEAQKFNAMSAAERLARINQELDKYAGASNRFAKSFVANWTTLKDNIKYSVLAEATAPLFERIKTSLASVNAWFDANTDRVKAFTRIVGKDLVAAWDAVAGRLSKLEPLIGRIEQGLAHMSASRVEGFLARGALGLAGAKLAGPAIAGGASVLGGALSAAGGAAKIAGSAAAMGALGSAMSVLANPVTLGAAAAAVALLGTAAVSVVGAIHALTDETSSYHQYAVGLWKEIQAIGTEAFRRIKSALEDVQASVTPFVDAMGGDLLFALRELAPLAVTVAQGLEAASSGLRHISDAIHRIPGIGRLLPGADEEAGMGPGRGEAGLGRGAGGMMKQAIDTLGDKLSKRGAGGGGGGTHVQKVEIVVNSNQDPSRIARLTAIEWRKWERNPKSSVHTSDWSAAHE
jgi:hypothetical protein